ncbi:hypothetical protein CTI12_AA393260 [Artemisia annua]|uniref:Uncharacterized protein n=1 Tax=Artemisia annua TaxID=35608 RepID=A0A2U1MDD4_ARTAN|nr:hypothetical protein CTI12_AA393260 [Artemisia annua]
MDEGPSLGGGAAAEFHEDEFTKLILSWCWIRYAAVADVAVSSPVSRQKATAGFGNGLQSGWGSEDLRVRLER